MKLTLRRGWWKPWDWSTRTWLISVLVVAVAWPICWRWYCLWQVPDVRVPFDVQEVYQRDYSNHQNALGDYQRVIQNFDSAKAKSSIKIDQAFNADRPVWDERIDEFLVNNREIIEDFRAVSNKEWLQVIPMKALDFYKLVRPLDRFREIAWLLESESIRCQRADQFEQAWSMYRIVFGMARQAEMQGFGISRLIAASLRGIACNGIAHWASNRTLTAEQLRQALLEFESLVAHRASFSDSLKVEYVMLLNTQSHPDFADELLPQWVVQATNRSEFWAVKRGFHWLNGQPDVAVRMAKQVAVNNFQLLDLPYSQTRVVFQSDKFVIFESGPTAKRERGQMSSSQLKNLLQSDFAKSHLKWDVAPQTLFYRRGGHTENARIAATRIVLAAQEFQRQHGEFPAKLDDLVPGFLDRIPEDPFTETVEPLKYRRDAVDRAIVWSVGQDGVDDGGELNIVSESEPTKDTGYRIMLSTQKQPDGAKKE